MKKKVVVCLPTYNEARNIKYVSTSILSFLPQAEILIIDDNSPDATGKIARSMSRQDARIFTLDRVQKEGLGKAYGAGFHYALEFMNADIVVQMDADMSHPPDVLPRMIDEIRNVDLVIGSRYIPGGGTKNWSMPRRIISRFGSLYARLLLGLPIHDPTGGFKVWSGNMLKQVLSNPITADGYGFQVETTYIAYRLGARILETPICFKDRNVGSSKMTVEIAFEAFWRIPLMRYNSRYYKKN